MTKKQRYQAFVIAMREYSDRPAMLIPLFERGLSIEDARLELQRLRESNFAMFKRVKYGGANQPTTHVERIITLDGARRKLARASIDCLCLLRGRRLAPDARQWIESSIEALTNTLANGA